MKSHSKKLNKNQFYFVTALPLALTSSMALANTHAHVSPVGNAVYQGIEWVLAAPHADTSLYQISKGNISSKKISSKKRNPNTPLSESEVAASLQNAGFDAEEVAVLTCTARFESSFNPKAKNENSNGTRDTGLFQVNDTWLDECGVTRAELADPNINAQCAKLVFDKQGAKAWMAYTKRKHICDNYEVGDFELSGRKTIKSIDRAYAYLKSQTQNTNPSNDKTLAY